MKAITRLENEKRIAITTNEAAYHLSRSPQTLRSWSHYKSGPIEPFSVGGRLMWRVADIKRVLGV